MFDIFLNMQNISVFLSIVFIQGTTGFGFGIILMCFIPDLLAYKMSVGISTLLL
jgi:hypothetical protein